MLALTLLSAFLAVGHALPLAARGLTNDSLAADLKTIAPTTATCDASAEYGNECRTNVQAAAPILNSFSKYGIDNVNERAAVIALMLYESGQFKYNWGHFLNGADQHEPGKGTRNMQSATFNEEYARTLFSADEVDKAKASANGADAVLQLVSPDKYSFASAAWFLKNKCDATQRTALQSGSQDGFQSYVTDCIGGTMDQDRIDWWTKAKAALAG
ncbi:uncharacterized protein BKCO1_5400082 [Diplodia corticola]|uniref:Uncharacterized protein n=1 Tax=Diplodia corticola TaxID=236234 RepID=A0A1J9RTW1_9PEZI|nr:uncharacterized protein BKCO1_5400082 [Diplodia corticola]OJD30941.1 hypothetical protein BKCO1_5400082 [Diplodia corticola]